MNFDPLEQKLEEYERQGWAERHDRRWNLTARGFLVSNQLIGDLLSLQEESTLEQTLPKLRQMERGGEVHVLEEGESPAPDSNKR